MASCKASEVSVDINHLECPVCLHVPRENILMCTNSHNICYDCYEDLSNPKTCPSCRQSYDFKVRRNFQMEQMIASLTEINFKCKFTKWGCSNVGDRDAIVAHEKLCTKQPFTCPANGCNKLISASNFVDHCTKVCKRFSFGERDDNELVVSFSSPESQTEYGPTIWSCNGVPFIYHWKYVRLQGISYFWVAVAGNEHVAKKYDCEIALVNDRIEPVYKYKGPVHSVEKGIDYVARTALGMPLTKDVILRYKKGEPAEGKKENEEYPKLVFSITIHDKA